MLLLPVDGSQHVMGYGMAESIVARLRPAMVVPHHYYIREVTQRQSTLQTADEWAGRQEGAVWLDGPSMVLEHEALAGMQGRVHYFGPHVAFDAGQWRVGKGFKD